MSRWTEAEAQDWWAARRWVCGINFLPSTAVNFLEMWHPDSFDRETIARELGWAGALGFNAVRVNLHLLVWQHDRDGLMERFDWFMETAARHGIDTVPCLFDDCGFGGGEPVYGPQPEPVPGVHNSRAVACPGRAALRDPALWPVFEDYVRDIVGTHRRDPRVLFWDIYNEPGNRMIFTARGAGEYTPDFTGASIRLMRDAFGWVREIAPDHPLSAAAWTITPLGSDADPYQTEADKAALELSDIITFHAYCEAVRAARVIEYLRRFGRPMLSTEWMARGVDSRIADQLQIYRDQRVGCFQWGLVKGRTQTWLPWPAEIVAAHGGSADKPVWFHDLLYPDGTPYDPAEIETLQSCLRSGAVPKAGAR